LIKKSKDRSGSGVTLSPFGRNKRVEILRPHILGADIGVADVDATPLPAAPPQDFDWNNSLIYTGIIAGLTFFTKFSGVSLIGDNIQKYLFLGVDIRHRAIFFTLAIKRGLRKS